jgi:acyl carrier protein
MNTNDELTKFILDELAIDHDKKAIAPDENLLMQGIIDSMGILKLSAFIQEKYGIQIIDSDMVPENFQTLNNLINFIQSKKSK